MFQSPASVNTQSTIMFEVSTILDEVSITCIGEHPVNELVEVSRLFPLVFQSPASVNTQSTNSICFITIKCSKFQSPASVNTQSTAQLRWMTPRWKVSITCIGEHPVNVHKRDWLKNSFCVSITCIGEHPVNLVSYANGNCSKMFQSPASVNTQSTVCVGLASLGYLFQSPASVNTQSTYIKWRSRKSECRFNHLHR